MRTVMRFLIHRYCNHQTLWVVASTILVTMLGIVGARFVLNGPEGTALGGHLGGDYPQFHAIGLLQNSHGTDRLYDLALQGRILRENVAGFPDSSSLPFVYPPFVALPFRLFAVLPYAWSFGAWLVVSAILYVTAIALTLRACPAFSPTDRISAWLLALSFSPFAIETLIGGQISCIGTFAVGIGIVCYRMGRPGWAGIALAMLLYKPTLLGLIGVMLVAGRRWKTLVGFAVGACLLGGLSIAVVGVGGSIEYVKFLARYGRFREEQFEIFQTFRYLDFTAAATLLGLSRGAAWIVAMTISAVVAVLLALAWHRSRRQPECSDLTWAATLSFVPLLTNYGPIYDAAIIVPGLILAADVIRRGHPSAWPTGFTTLIWVVYLSGVISSLFTSALHVQTLTLALTATGLYFLRAALAEEDLPEVTGDSSELPLGVASKSSLTFNTPTITSPAVRDADHKRIS